MPLLLLPDVLIPFFRYQLGLMENASDFLRYRIELSTNLLESLQETRQLQAYVRKVDLQIIADHLATETGKKVGLDDLVGIIFNYVRIIEDREINILAPDSYAFVSLAPSILCRSGTSAPSKIFELEELTNALSSGHFNLGEDNHDEDTPPSVGNLPRNPNPTDSGGAGELTSEDNYDENLPLTTYKDARSTADNGIQTYRSSEAVLRNRIAQALLGIAVPSPEQIQNNGEILREILSARAAFSNSISSNDNNSWDEGTSLILGNGDAPRKTTPNEFGGTVGAVFEGMLEGISTPNQPSATNSRAYDRGTEQTGSNTVASIPDVEISSESKYTQSEIPQTYTVFSLPSPVPTLGPELPPTPEPEPAPIQEPEPAPKPTVLSGSGGSFTFLLDEDSATVFIEDFSGVGKGSSEPSDEDETDILQFSGERFIPENLLLKQEGNHLIFTFKDVNNVRVVLRNFSMDELDNLPQGNNGNILFNGDVLISDSFDVFKASARPNQIFNLNTVTFLNALNNSTSGFDNSQDVINGQGGNDTLHGFSGDDLLRGESGDNQLYGGDGDDILNGGEGDNQLYGGAGSDQFILDKAGKNIVSDFVIGDDSLVLPDNITLNEVEITHRIDTTGKVNTIVAHNNGKVLAVLEEVEATKEEIFPEQFNHQS